MSPGACSPARERPRVGGVALPGGVMLLSSQRLSAAYYDRAGRLHRVERTLRPPSRLLWLGPLWNLLLQVGWGARLMYASLFALFELSPLERRLAQLLLGAAYAGVLWALLLRPLLGRGAGGHAHDGWILLGALAFVALAFRLEPTLGELLRFHAAEHMVIHALEQGLPLTLEHVRAQPTLHPRCGSNLVALGMPLVPVAEALGGWGWLLLLGVGPLLLHLLDWAAGSRHPVASALLRAGEVGQRLMLRPAEERHLQAAVVAAERLLQDRNG